MFECTGRIADFRPIALRYMAFLVLIVAMALAGCVPTDQPEASIVRPATTAAATPLIEAPPGRALIIWQREEGHDYFMNTLHIGWKSPLFTEENSLWFDILDYRESAQRRRNNQFAGHVIFDPRNETAFITALLPGSYVFNHRYWRSAIITWSGPTGGRQLLSRTLREGEVLFGYLARSGAITLSATPPAGWSAARLAQLRTFDNQARILDYFRDHRMWRANQIAMEIGLDGCPQGDFETHWSNARFSGIFEGCARFSGTMDYETGERLTVREAVLGQPGTESTLLKSVVYSDSDSTRYHGAWSLANASLANTDRSRGGRILPLPSLGGMGQEIRADGSGIVGRFVDGRIQGAAWCFDVLSGEECRFENGKRLTETGAERRPVAEILALEPGLSPSMTIDLLRQRQIQALLGERWAEFLQLETDLSALGIDSGIEALFYVGRALSALGRYEAALPRIQAYLNIAGASGASYGDALSLFAELRSQAEAERQTRLTRENEARAEREQFCRATQTSGDALCGCREFPGLGIQIGSCS